MFSYLDLLNIVFIVVKIVVVMLLLPTCERYFLFPKPFKSNVTFTSKYGTRASWHPAFFVMFPSLQHLIGPVLRLRTCQGYQGCTSGG